VSVIITFFLLLAGALAQSEQSSTVAPSPEAAAGVATSPNISDKESRTLSQTLATQAASEKLPQVSLSILRTQLQKETDPQARQRLTLRLGEMLVVAHSPEEALTVLDAKDVIADPMISFWKAQALLASGQFATAEPLLQSLLTPNSPLSRNYLDATALALARTERALGKGEEGLKAVEKISPHGALALQALEERCAILLALKRNDEVEQLLKAHGELSGEPRLLYLAALAALQRGDQKEALHRFMAKAEPLAAGGWTSAATVGGVAISQMALHKPEEAQVVLEKYLQENPNSPRLPQLMTQLEECYALQTNRDPTILYKWVNDPTESYRASYAVLPLGRMLQRQGHYSKSDVLYQSFLNNSPTHPLAGEIRLELAQSKLDQGDPEAALSLLKQDEKRETASSSAVDGRIAFLRGLAESILKHRELAEQAFHQAEMLDPTLAGDAQYNRILLHLSADPSKEQSSSQQTQSDDASADQTARKEYLSVMASDHGDRASADTVIQSARAFLAAHPHSSFYNEVRMKLGEALFRKGLVRDARIELENVGHAASTSPLGRQALLLAAQAAARSMDPKSLDDAMMILEQVAQNKNAPDDAWQARLEQSALKNAQAQPLESIAIDDQILAAPDVPVEVRRTAQMAKGDTLSNLGPKDPNNYRAAVATWRALADTTDIPPRWRNQALCKIGLIEEKLGENDTALATYYEAIKTPRLQEPEQLWHDKAAFEAARLLETRHQWNEAITLYQQISNEAGPRAAEATARVSKLRLENFLWQ
jgi:tetratricopeptide (TPR) repeat protein